MHFCIINTNIIYNISFTITVKAAPYYGVAADDNNDDNVEADDDAGNTWLSLQTSTTELVVGTLLIVLLLMLFSLFKENNVDCCCFGWYWEIVWCWSLFCLFDRRDDITETQALLRNNCNEHNG